MLSREFTDWISRDVEVGGERVRREREREREGERERERLAHLAAVSLCSW